MNQKQLEQHLANPITLTPEESAEAKTWENKQQGLKLQQADMQRSLNDVYSEIAAGNQAWWRKTLKNHNLMENCKELVYGLEWDDENPDQAKLAVVDILTPQAGPGQPEQALLDQVVPEPPPTVKAAREGANLIVVPGE